MNKLIPVLFASALIFVLPKPILAQLVPVKIWDKTYGGDRNEYLRSLDQTTDGGYILGGWSGSGLTGDKTQASKGRDDFWLVKVDANGNKTWDKSFGGNQDDRLLVVRQTSDGGYILSGQSDSGISGDKTQASRGTNDLWIVKTDANGNKLWDKTYGGSDVDWTGEIIQTSDGGYLLAGSSASPISGDKTVAPKGGLDFWVLKLDAAGNKLWEKTCGGPANEYVNVVLQTTDGGYILGGSSNSGIGGDKTQTARGGFDAWIIKLDVNGIKMWDKTYGGGGDDHLRSLLQTADGGYIFTGESSSWVSGDKTQASKGGFDFWVVKMDANGSKTWDKTIGGSSDDASAAMVQTAGGGYVIGGRSFSNISGDKTANSYGNHDFWLVQLDGTGSKVWDKTLGGSLGDELEDLQMTPDGGFILGGASWSNISGDKTENARGMGDFWIMKLVPACSVLAADLTGVCTAGGADVNLNISGLQYTTTGTPSWTLTYTENGVTQTVTGTTATYVLAANAPVGTVYSLVNLTAGSCSKNLNDSFTVQGVPATPAVTNGNNCVPGPVVLSTAGAPVGGSYAWYDVATGGTALQTSPADTFMTQVLTSTATYYVSAINNAGCEGPRAPVTATITILTPATGPAQTICSNAAPIQLSGFSPVGGTWSGPGVSATGVFTPTPSLTGLQTLTYTVTQNGCSASATQDITVTAAPVVNAGAAQTICADAAPVQLSGFSPAGGLWSGTGVTQTGLFTPASSLVGSHTLTYIVNQNGCTDSAVKIITIPMLLSQSVITLSGSDSLQASVTGNSYEWKLNGTTLPANSQKIKPTASGNYTVQVTDVNNCVSPVSAAFAFTVTGISEAFAPEFSLYPNPASGKVSIELQEKRQTEITVLNSLGQVVYSRTLEKNTDRAPVIFDMTGAASGIYLVRVNTGIKVMVKKLVVE